MQHGDDGMGPAGFRARVTQNTKWQVKSFSYFELKTCVATLSAFDQNERF
jgi:hypothetical protein